MQENNFDKKLQEEMDAFRMQPSHEVWVRVEAEIRDKRRRKFIAFFLLLAGILILGGGSYYLFTENKQPGTVADLKNQKKRSADTILRNNYSDNEEKSKDTNERSKFDLSDDRGTIRQEVILKSGITNDSLIIRQQRLVNDSKVKPIVTKTQQGLGNDSMVNSVIEKKQHTLIIDPKSNDPLIKQQALVNDSKKNPSGSREQDVVVIDSSLDAPLTKRQKTVGISIVNPPVVKDDSKDQSVMDSPGNNSSNDINKKLVINSSDTMLMVKTAATVSSIASMPQQKRQLRFGIEFVIGSSNDNQRTLFPSRQDQLYATVPITGGGGLFNPQVDHNKSVAFSFGFTGNWKLSKRSSVNFGLRYQYLSSKINVGFLRDTNLLISNYNSQSISLDNYYSPGVASSFTNRFHFIQLPVAYQFQLNRSSHYPITWDGGANIGYLINSKALLYEPSRNFYYNDPSAFKRLKLSLNTGLSIGILNRRGFEWKFGPMLQFDLTRQLKTEFFPQKRFVFIGLNSKFFFTKKK